VDIVHRFARELRPAVLDDLGLIPALHSFMKNFGARTGLLAHLTAFAAVENLDAAKRTVLYRVAQEALTNVARHAKASRVDVNIHQQNSAAFMEIKDDGKSFEVERRLHGKGSKRLGLLGMRERVEMVGGTFCIESSPGQGTIVRVEIPLGHTQKQTPKKNGKTPLTCP
jgi:signal transduction histidine kinase